MTTKMFLTSAIEKKHGLRTPREEKSLHCTAENSLPLSQIFRYGQSIFCLPHWPNFSDYFDLCLHWVSVEKKQTLVKVL